MPSLTTFAAVAVVLAALFLLALGAASLLAPARASRFLLGFAGSANLHYAELALRLLAGAAFVLYAPHMRSPAAFALFGWVLLGTTAVLLLVPWQWHRRFAERAVPLFTRYIALIGVVSAAGGGAILFAVARGQAG